MILFEKNSKESICREINYVENNKKTFILVKGHKILIKIMKNRRLSYPYVCTLSLYLI